MASLISRRRPIIAALIGGGISLGTLDPAGSEQELSPDFTALVANLISQERRRWGQAEQEWESDRPGSLAKVIAAAIALEEGITTPLRQIHCSGGMGAPPHTGLGHLPCWDPRGHGSLTLVEAIEFSCNVHFYTLGMELGLSRMRRGLEQFGLKGDRIRSAPHVATGEDPGFRVDLDQVLNLASWVARRDQGNPLVNLSPEVWDVLQAGMVAAAQEGTARGIAPPGYRVAAKTGTLMHPNALRSNHSGSDPNPFYAWVMAYWPVTKPKYAMALRLNHGKAYAEAIPIARAVIREAQF